ncbi:MAG: hypothetical protein ABL962_00250, partial [Fimbriimonadaceae bacterium]
IAKGKYDPMIGKSADWDAATLWTADLEDSMIRKLTKELGVPTNAIASGTKVISYLDSNFPRDTWDDIFFYKRPEAVKKKDGGQSSEMWIGFGLVSAVFLGISVRKRRS